MHLSTYPFYTRSELFYRLFFIIQQPLQLLQLHQLREYLQQALVREPCHGQQASSLMLRGLQGLRCHHLQRLRLHSGLHQTSCRL